MNNLGNLPTELIVQIVRGVNSTDLYACALINRHFHAVVNPMLWCTINVKHEISFGEVMTGLVESKPPMGKHVRNVHLDDLVTDADLLVLMDRVPNLENLTMKYAGDITDTSLQHLPSSCPKLKKLSLRGLDVIPQLFILALAQHCSQLSELVLTGDQGLPYDALWALTACPLEKLSIDLYPGDSDDDDDGYDIGDDEDEDDHGGDDDGDDDDNGYDEDYGHGDDGGHDNGDDDDDDMMDDNEAILDGLVGFQHSRSLKINSAPTRFTQQLITSLTLHPDWLPSLNAFELNECWDVTERQVIAFMKTRPALKTLSLTQNNFGNTYLDAIAASLPNIARVDLAQSGAFTASGICRLIVNCPLLVWIGLHGCGIPGEEFPEFAGPYLDRRGLLDHLDEHAIEAIRVGWNENDDSDFDDDLDGD